MNEYHIEISGKSIVILSMLYYVIFSYFTNDQLYANNYGNCEKKRKEQLSRNLYNKIQ